MAKRKGKKSRVNSKILLAPDAYITASLPGGAAAGKRFAEHLTAGCPAPKTHARLADCHTFWHRALDEYQTPHGFRREINVLLQALRNVTWILQSERAAIPEFDSWYGDWQRKMRGDPVMLWLVEARNTVVKQGDLEAHSASTAKVVYAYSNYQIEVTEDEFRSWVRRNADGEQELAAPPSVTMPEQRRILAGGLPERVTRDGFIEYRRQWVDDKLPGIELLDACGRVYGCLSQVLADLHERCGIALGMGGELGNHSITENDEHLDGVPPCMIAPDVHVMRRRLSDGSLVVGGLRLSSPDDTPEMAARRSHRYSLPPPPDRIDDITDLVVRFVSSSGVVTA